MEATGWYHGGVDAHFGSRVARHSQGRHPQKSKGTPWCAPAIHAGVFLIDTTVRIALYSFDNFLLANPLGREQATTSPHSTHHIFAQLRTMHTWTKILLTLGRLTLRHMASLRISSKNVLRHAKTKVWALHINFCP